MNKLLLKHISNRIRSNLGSLDIKLYFMICNCCLEGMKLELIKTIVNEGGFSRLVFTLSLVILFTVGCGIPEILPEGENEPSSQSASENLAEKPVLAEAAVQNQADSSHDPEQRSTPTAQVTRTATLAPTATQTKTPVFIEERAQILALMESYNYVDADQLSDEYWEKLAERLNKYGTAERLLSLEFHGDEYDMFAGFYAMTVESFMKQMRDLMENDYHFATIHEVQGFVSGWLDLPLRSVILTTDPGRLPWESTERMVATFTELEAIYGYKPHMNTFIVSYGMNAEENYLCKDNRCWLAYVHAVESGYFSLGTHTHWHNFHDQVSEYAAMVDIRLSQNEIYANTGINVYAITWPYEICSPYLEMLVNELGITLGFGGLSRPNDNYVYKSDSQFLCLPRLFPENPSGISGRPAGKTLMEMLSDAHNVDID